MTDIETENNVYWAKVTQSAYSNYSIGLTLSDDGNNGIKHFLNTVTIIESFNIEFNIYQRLIKIILIFPLMIMEVLVHDHCYPSLT